MKTSEAQLKAVAAYRKKCIVYAVRINPETEPKVAARILDLKRKKQVTAFLKDALENYKVDEVV